MSRMALAKNFLPALLATLGLLVLLELMLEVALGSLIASPRSGPLEYRGLGLEYIGGLWFILVGWLAWSAAVCSPDVERRLQGHLFVLTTLGLAGSSLLVYDTFGRHQLPAQYWLAVSVNVALFGISAVRAQGATSETVRYAVQDLVLAARQRPTIIALATVAILVTLAPGRVGTPGTLPEGPSFQTWFRSQPRVAFPRELPLRMVHLAVFADYQCPACRRAEALYAPVLREISTTHRDTFRLLRLDFPIESECLPPVGAEIVRDNHPLACEAAFATRLVRVHHPDREEDLRNWLYDNQRSLTHETISARLSELLGIAEPFAGYSASLDAIRQDAAVGRQLGVDSTPTYWLNGVMLQGQISPANLRWALLDELENIRK